MEWKEGSRWVEGLRKSRIRKELFGNFQGDYQIYHQSPRTMLATVRSRTRRALCERSKSDSRQKVLDELNL